MKDLIQRLEQASAGSRELDALIFCAVLHPDKKPTRNFHYTNKDEWGVFVSNQPKPGTTFYDAPHYTTSLDAALTLAPPDAFWRVANIHEGVVGGYAFVSASSNQFMSIHDLRGEFIPTPENRSTPALALCIAALRAIEAEKDNE